MAKMHDYEIRKQLFMAFNNQPLKPQKLKKRKKKVTKVKKTISVEAAPVVNHLYNFGENYDSDTDVIDLNIDIRPKLAKKRALILSRSNNDIVQPVTTHYRFSRTQQSEGNSSTTSTMLCRKKTDISKTLMLVKASNSYNSTSTSSQKIKKSSKKKCSESKIWEEFETVKNESEKIKRHLLNVLYEQKNRSLKPREYGLVGNLWMKQLYNS